MHRPRRNEGRNCHVDSVVEQPDGARYRCADRHAARGARSGADNHRNGCRDRIWEARAGTVELRIPKPRKVRYFPGLLESPRTADKALTAVIQEAYVQGISTGLVDDLVESLGMTGISRRQVSRLCAEIDDAEIDDEVRTFLDRP